MVDDKKVSDSDKEEVRSYRTIGAVFLLAGLALVIPGDTLEAGIPFLIIGLVFITLGAHTLLPKRKKM